jgi:hypothetical protein
LIWARLRYGRHRDRPGRNPSRLGHRHANAADIPVAITLRDLIRTRVREEIARANAEPSAEARTLVEPVDAERTLNGYRLREPRRIDWEKQADVALEGFGRNGFFVLVGGRQVDDLDQELELAADSDIRFVKLTPLVGG